MKTLSMKPIFVFFTVYQVERVCGGSEEGGWYYNQYTPIEYIQCKAKQEIKGNRYSFKPLKSDKKALQFIAENEAAGFVVYSETQLFENSVGHRYYC